MSLQLIDLRKAGLREYPEFGEVPWPRPWYRAAGGWILAYYLGVSVFVVAAVVFIR